MTPNDDARATFQTSARSAAADERSHPISVGQMVTVISGTPPFIEGHAAVRGAAPGRHRYRLQFIGDPSLRERFVHPAYQHDPEGSLDWLLEFWRASIEAPLFDEFFSDDIEPDGA